MIHRLFLVIAMYCQASSSQFNESLNLPRCQLAGKEAQVHAVGSNSLETTYILFKFPYSRLQGGEGGKGRRSTRGLLLLIELSFGAWNSCAIVVQRQLPAKSPQYQRNNNCEIAITYESFDFKRFYKGFFFEQKLKKIAARLYCHFLSFCLLFVLCSLFWLDWIC